MNQAHQNIKYTESFNDIYSDSSKYTQRYQNLSQKFQQHFNQKVEYFARAPGRVNLIGEHIDYMNYPVFPFALEQDCLIAFSHSNDDQLHIHHVNPDVYESVHLPAHPSKKGDVSLNNKQQWAKYIYAGFFSGTENVVQDFKGVNMLVCSTVPIAAGLSSSSSFVVCGAILGYFILGSNLDSHNLLQRIIQYERNLGTACGGMDQTISLLGVRGKAMFIEFNEYARNVECQLPGGVSFVIANSLKESPKLQTLGRRMAIKILGDKMGIQSEKKLTNLRQLVRNGETLKQMQENVKKLIQQKVYSKEEIEALVNNKLEVFLNDVQKHEIVIEQNTEYFPYERALHVYSEAERVYLFKEICEKQDLSNEEKMTLLGNLMNDSQYSCDQLYDCSSDELNELIQVCRKNGSLGSRLTGAGWGGCTVSMVKNEDVEQFIKNVKEQYYVKNGLQSDESVIFCTQPCNGAMIYKNNQF